MYIALFIALIILQGLDIYTTTSVLKAGGRELNPILNYLFKKFDVLPAFIFYDVVITALLILVKPPMWFMGAIVVAWAAVVVWNFTQLRKINGN